MLKKGEISLIWLGGRTFYGGRWWGQRFLGGKTPGKFREQSSDRLDWNKRFVAGKTSRFETQGQARDSAERSRAIHIQEPRCCLPCPSHQEGINLNLIKGSLDNASKTNIRGYEIGPEWVRCGIR